MRESLFCISIYSGIMFVLYKPDESCASCEAADADNTAQGFVEFEPAAASPIPMKLASIVLHFIITKKKRDWWWK
jgi:hypothetical protein